MNEPILEIRDIHIQGHTNETWITIVDHISLTLHRGEVLGLIGESGAGKSTLGLAAMAYARDGCRIHSGSIRFDTLDLMSASDRQLHEVRGNRIAYVAQSAAASFNPAHTLIQQFAEAAVQHGISSVKAAHEKAKKLYRQLELPDPENIGYRYPHQVSGGQLQRAMVAMAMSCEPDLIIFDEPTTALDVTTQIEVLAAIKNAVKNNNTAAIYVTHDLAVVAQMADQIMVLRDGKLVEEAETRIMLEQPRETYTQDLLNVRKNQKVSTDNEDLPIVLRCRNVTAEYVKNMPIVSDIDLSVCAARTVAVVGESGSGKSTLARVITGLLEPTKGRIEFAGKPLAGSYRQRSRQELQKIQMIYQLPDIALNPRQKISEVIGRPLTFYFGITGRDRQKKVDELLEMIDLPTSFSRRIAPELSGGQKQRVCIARALAAQPELIICDEVTSALDQLVAEGILKLLQSLQTELSVSYLFITHDLATVRAIADEIVVMYQGNIVEQGARDTILNPPHQDYTELLLSSVPQMNPDWLDDVIAQRSTH